MFIGKTDIAGIDAVFGQRLGGFGIGRKQRVAVIMEIADERDIATERIEFLADGGNGCGGRVVIHRYAHDFRTGLSQRMHLRYRGGDIRRVGVGHRLHHDGRLSAERDMTNGDGQRYAAGEWQGTLFFSAIHSLFNTPVP